METLNSFTDRNKIIENNLNAAREFGIYEMCMEIAPIMFSHWKSEYLSLPEEKKHEYVFARNRCFGANTEAKRSNPNVIHLGWDLQIDPQSKKLNEVFETELSNHLFNPEQGRLVKEILTKYGYTIGTSNSVLAGEKI